MNFKILSIMILAVLVSSSSVISASAESIKVRGADVEFAVNGASVSDIMIDETFSSMLVNLADSSSGDIEVTIPRAILDAKLGNLDDIFFVLVDDLEVDFEEVATDATSRTLSIQFPSGSEVIEIIGTDVGSVQAAPVKEPTPEKESAPADTAKESGGCLIATAAFGTELAPQVQFLREVRDNTVMSTASGAAFMTGFNQLYYSFSPTIADIQRESPVFQQAVKLFITPMISTLSIMTLADQGSESDVLTAGISVIALNLAMYVAVPAMVAFKVSQHIKSRK